ncbi:SMP-30/gluconolactonase/LRE family protein [Kordiimonas sp. SCSIO 12610]|uniref:SMP-30/gluconolactonase/LRE family protein n=1 Tax=Kordiimonas sp. SCSIO 12610 TaxID=2829597 RepID=UPI00210AB00F|nr:SMP-30/gluconolactonase/LRE family protein [Kordiimonas sp. SCSIO 12610]UTW56810.1 SMP-30/gluconolactonase/LRE family protein [Kordiimonas sp. SCSIO 12610]
MKKTLLGIVALILVGIVIFVLIPAPIDPVAYNPPASKGFVDGYAQNDGLADAEVISLGEGMYGPEDVAVDESGRIYGGLHDGRIVRILPDGTQEVFADTKGRPLGLHFDQTGNLIVADSWKGLLSIDPAGEITVLTTEADGLPFAFTDDLDIASDGKIYFSDASSKYTQPDYVLDLLEARGHGRLLVFDPATGETKSLLDNLYFANGIALSKNEDFVLVNETGRYRITRYWLKGEKAGSSDIFVDNLPGFPDGVSSNRNGVFWVAMPTPRSADVDNAHPSPFTKKLLSKLPKFMQPAAIKYGLVLAFDEEGNLLGSYHDTDGNPTYMVTSVEQVGDQIYLGSLEAPQIVRLNKPID